MMGKLYSLTIKKEEWKFGRDGEFSFEPMSLSAAFNLTDIIVELGYVVELEEVFAGSR